MIALDPIASSVLRLGLSGLLLWSAWHKLRAASTFRAAVAGYGLVPEPLVTLTAVVIMAAELTLGFGLVIARTGSMAAVGGAVLLSTYTAAIAVNLARGRTRIDCGCGGPAGALPLSPALVVRNLVLVGLSLCAALPIAERELGLADLSVVAAATVAFAFLYAAAETALANASRWRTRTKVGFAVQLDRPHPHLLSSGRRDF